MTGTKYDILYTWVDDSFPGFREERAQYATDSDDLNPERTRDNLDLLKYSLRSIERYAPWRGKVWIVTCRPQVPAWLNTEHPDVRIAYLDEFMPAEELASYNAFAIESYVHQIPDLSDRYVHFNDDMLLMRKVGVEHFTTAEGRLKYYFDRLLPAEPRPDMAPHGAGRRNVWHTLEKTFGRGGGYPQHAHQPRIIDKSDMERLVSTYPEEFARTRAARFRAHDTILPHKLLAAYLVQEGRAEYVGFRRTKHLMRMVRLYNWPLRNPIRLFWAWMRHPHFLCLNDDFGPLIDERAASVARRFLKFLFPDPSGYES
jgi:hypothetical protein